ncbi:MAG: hypothetical protein ACFE0Q_19570 [Anaerolineae bacterium]
MADHHNLPPLQDNPDEDTVPHEMGVTRPHAPLRVEKDETERNTKHRTEMMPAKHPTIQRERSARGGKHVQPQPNTPSRQGAPSAYPPRPRQRAKSDASNSALYLPWWSIALMLLAVIIVSFSLVAGVYFVGGADRFLVEPSPIIMVVTADQSALNTTNNNASQPQAPSTQIISGQNAPTSLELTGPTLAPIELSPTPNPIQINSVVIVEGVDLNTLNVRTVPNLLESQILFRAEEGEIFTVLDGPQQSDGFTWWQIQDLSDVNRTGWAVSNFLSVQTP